MMLIPAILALAASVEATFVIQCYSRLMDTRADPVVTPGTTSPHVHAIAGGNGFGFEMDYEQARASTCTTCNVKEDLSNYWTPKMYYRNQNGTFENVRVNGDVPEYNLVGGMAIYYLHRPGPDNDEITPFPPGFRMVAGDPSLRSFTDTFAQRAVRHRCIGTNFETNELPNFKCPGGIRVQVVFPACWDGVNLDSDDHKSHVAYPMDGNFDGGRCPPSHPKHLMTLFFEVTYRTDMFADRWWEQSDTVKHPFVFSNGDPTGYGFHGDFVNGWDPATLAKGVKNCVDGTPNCPEQTFTLLDGTETAKCLMKPLVDEQVDGLLEQLPGGCNPVTFDQSKAKSASGSCDLDNEGGNAGNGGNDAPATGTDGGDDTTDEPATTASAVASATTTGKATASATVSVADDTPSTASATTLPSSLPSSAPASNGTTTSSGYSYIGCGTDSVYDRTFGKQPYFTDMTMTIDKCLSFCKDKGLSYAGLEYAHECYCGKSLRKDRAPVDGKPGNCVMKCDGDKSQTCGGPAAMSLYYAGPVKRSARRHRRGLLGLSSLMG